MIPVVAAERLSHAVARAECDLGREAVTERLLHAVEVLLERRSERQCRLDPVDASSNEPVRCKRLRTLNVPAGRSPCPETRIEGVMHPLARETRVTECELGFDRHEIGVAIRGNRRTLAFAQPPSVRERRAD